MVAKKLKMIIIRFVMFTKNDMFYKTEHCNEGIYRTNQINNWTSVIRTQPWNSLKPWWQYELLP